MVFNEKGSSGVSERVLRIFFKPPALTFSRALRSRLDKDPEYLKHHELEVFPQMQQLLREAGIPMDEKTPAENMRHVIREVVVRLRSFEKGEE
jgi:hypothetical protein